MQMQPPSFDDFIRRESTKSSTESPRETFKLETCPTPGCSSHALKVTWDGGKIMGFRCANGCEFTARRNVFTGDIMYYILTSCHLRSAEEVKGMKFTPLGEAYLDWY